MIVCKNGNILSTSADIICQQVNCQGVMGSGLAKKIRQNYPNCYEEYRKFCKNRSPNDLLGKVNFVNCTSKCWGNRTIIIANIFGQLNYGRNPNYQYTCYVALKNGLQKVQNHAKLNNLSVAIPHKIGCGLGGGNWIQVRRIIQDIFCDEVLCEIWKFD